MQVKLINFSNLKYVQQKQRLTPKESVNPVRYGQFFNIYLNGRKEISNLYYLLLHIQYAYENLHKLRIIKDKNILAGYTYKLRHNKLGEKSLYVDGLARDLTNKKSKNVMGSIYNDIKNTALKHNAKEITLFVSKYDKRLKQNYKNLGFEQDFRTSFEDLDLMRVRTNKFLNNQFFKNLQFKNATGKKFIIQNFSNNTK